MRELIALLIIVALIVEFIWWILGAAALAAVFVVVRSAIRADRAQRAAIAQLDAEIAARAERQHRWVLDGDDRGVYGDYPIADIVGERE